MICIEIKKSGQVYQFDLEGQADLHEAHLFALDIATGNAEYVDPTQIIDLGTSKDYEHIRVWKTTEAAQGPAVEPPQLPAQKEDEDFIKSFEDRITWLGQDLKLKGVKAMLDGVPFILIYEINNEPAQVQVSKDNLEGLTDYQGRVLGYTAPIAIIPPGDLHSEEDALEYVEDYLNEIRKEAEEKQDEIKELTARAYVGFVEVEE